jgi:cytochrome c553
MKHLIVSATLIGYLVIVFGCNGSLLRDGAASLAVVDGRTPKDVYELSADSKKPDGAIVIFNHLNHSTKNYSIDGTKPIACAECHHTDQPAAEAAKKPPLKTAYPADRTTTLTADLMTKDPKAPEVLGCRACHAQAGTKPRIGAAIPEVVYEGDTDAMVLDNEKAYHNNCNACHDAVAEARPTVKIVTSKQCKECHTGKK